MDRSTLLGWIAHDHASVFGVALVVIGAALAQPEMRQNQIHANSLKAERMQIRTEQQFSRVYGDLANQRYRSGCVFARDLESGELIALSNDMQILDPISRQPLPVGALICDELGNTAAIVPGINGEPILGSFAYTGDREVVDAALAAWNSPQPTMIVRSN